MSTLTKTKDAIALLKADHKKVKHLFDEFEKAGDSEKLELAQEAIKELKIHSVIEEEIFYPAAHQALGAKKEEEGEVVDEAEEEHRVAKTLIEEIQNLKPHQEHFEAKFTVLAENIRHHIKEEEGTLFPKVKKTDLDLESLGEQMADRKNELLNDEDLLGEAVQNSEIKPYQELRS
jgi:hemerythrin superfamily protein